MAKKTAPPAQPAAKDIHDRNLGEIIAEKYLSYALSTIMSRSLPDVRDGLKPVHRRVLYAMAQLNLRPELSPKKSARVVGDVIGKFHPHGDQSVYDALVRLAQDFSVRYPLVDGQGNFGNIDGDNAAAMRYTEARLTAVSQLLMEDLEFDTVDFRPTYDGDTEEPIVMPANFPNLLANGSSGIAVGMATNIPPHNVAELCQALEHLIDTPDCAVKDLLKYVKGPDFPTGGIIAEDKAAIQNAYETGRGSFRTRAVWAVEKLKGDAWQIVVTEIPYQVQKSRLIEKIAEGITTRKLPFLDDITDELAEDVRVVLAPKSKDIAPELLMAQLFKNTDLESRFSLNMNVLDGGLVPRVMNLKEVLQAFVNHRQDVLVRRSKFRLAQIDHRLEILAGLLIAYLNIDEVIHIIRTQDDPKAVMIKKFKLSEVQVDAILNMRLRSLRKLEEIEIKREHKDLLAEKADIEKLLASRARQMTAIKKQVARIGEMFDAKSFLGKRRTQISNKAPLDDDIPMEALVQREPITVICSDKGWIRSIKGHLEADKIDALNYKDGDSRKFVLHCETTDKLVAFATNGKFYTLSADKLPATTARGFGEPIRLMIDLQNEAELVTLVKHDPGRKLLVAADDGRGFLVDEKEILSQTKNGRQCLLVKDGVEAKICAAIEPSHDMVATIGENRKLLIFPLDQVPDMARGVGVILQRFKDGGLADAKTFRRKEGLSWHSGGRERTETNIKAWIGERAQSGMLPPNGFPRTPRFKGT